MIVDLDQRSEKNSLGVVTRTIVCGLLRDDYREINAPPQRTSVIASLDVLCEAFPAGTRVRITIERAS